MKNKTMILTCFSYALASLLFAIKNKFLFLLFPRNYQNFKISKYDFFGEGGTINIVQMNFIKSIFSVYFGQ